MTNNISLQDAAAKIEVNRNSGAFPTSDARYTEATVALQGDDAATHRFSMFNGLPNVLSFVRYGGTAASKSATPASGGMGIVGAFGFDGSNITGAKASIDFKAVSNWTSTDNSTLIDVRTTAVGSVTLTTRFSVDEKGITLKNGGGLISDGVVRLKGYTVATLPAGTIGDTAYVTDALAPAYGAVLVGGGAGVVKAFYNGANWIAG